MLLTKLLPEQSTQKSETTEIEILPAPPLARILEKNEKTIVRETKVPTALIKKDSLTKTDLTSAETIRVEKQMRAAASGLTQNSIDDRPLLTKSQQQAKASQPTEKQQLDNLANNSEQKNSDFQKHLKEWEALSGNGGPSTFGEVISDDIPIGSMTALNTDRNTYYSFYARVESLVRFRWESKIQQITQSLNIGEIEFLNQQSTWITQVEFLIKPDGTLTSALLMRESGVKNFDAAAIAAFKDARIFPNPPKELVQSDGYIHLKYGFQVRWKPVRLAKPNK